MRHAAVCAVLALAAGWALTSAGCKKSSGPDSTPVVKPVPIAPAVERPAPATGASGELQSIAAGWRSLRADMAKTELPYRLIAAKGWNMAASVDQIMKLAERSTGSATVPAKGASPEEISRLAFALGMAEDKTPEFLHDVELIGINAKNLAASAGSMDGDETRKWWGQLDKLCQGVCGSLAAPAGETKPGAEKPPANPPPAGKR
jgi:hypothetical protein